MVAGTHQQALWKHEQIIRAIPKQGKCVCLWGGSHLHSHTSCMCVCVRACMWVGVRACTHTCVRVCQLLVGSALFLAFPFKLLSSHFPKKRSCDSGSPGTFIHIWYFWWLAKLWYQMKITPDTHCLSVCLYWNTVHSGQLHSETSNGSVTHTLRHYENMENSFMLTPPCCLVSMILIKTHIFFHMIILIFIKPSESPSLNGDVPDTSAVIILYQQPCIGWWGGWCGLGLGNSKLTTPVVQVTPS